MTRTPSRFIAEVDDELMRAKLLMTVLDINPTKARIPIPTANSTKEKPA